MISNYGYGAVITYIPPVIEVSNFAFLFSGVYPELKNIDSGGKIYETSGFDIVFTPSIDSLIYLDHKIVSFDGDTGEFTAWVKIPNSGSGTLAIIYGNAAINFSQENQSGLPLSWIPSELVYTSYTVAFQSILSKEGYDTNMYNWADIVDILSGYAKQDVDFFTLSDAIAISSTTHLLNVVGIDTLAFLDSTLIAFSLNRSASDFLFLSDRIERLFSISQLNGDSLSLSDVYNIVMSFINSDADIIVMDDAILINLNENKLISAAEAMVMSDAVSLFKSTSDLAYLRRYLNDVAR